MFLFLTPQHSPFTSIPLSIWLRFTVFALMLKLSILLHTCLHSYVKLLQPLLSHCLFVILSFYSVGLSDAARCHNAAVTAGAGAITRHTHHGKHTCLYAFMYSQFTHTHTHKSTHTHGPMLMSAGLLIRLLLRAAVRLRSLTLIKVTADGDHMAFSKYCDRREELLGHLLSIPYLPACLADC